MPMSEKARQALARVRDDEAIGHAAHADTLGAMRRVVMEIQTSLPAAQMALDEVDDPTDRAVGIEEMSQKLSGLRERLVRLQTDLQRAESSLREIDRETPKIEARLEAREPTTEE